MEKTVTMINLKTGKEFEHNKKFNYYELQSLLRKAKYSKRIKVVGVQGLSRSEYEDLVQAKLMY